MPAREKFVLPSIVIVRVFACGTESTDVRQGITLDDATELWLGSATDSTDWFADVNEGRLSPEGGTYVLDGAEPFIRHYDARGSLLKRFLPKGGGPGEISLPQTLASCGLADSLSATAVGSRCSTPMVTIFPK